MHGKQSAAPLYHPAGAKRLSGSAVSTTWRGAGPRWFARALASTLCIVALSSCGGGGGADATATPTTPTPPTPPSTSSSINVVDNAFSPSATQLPVGTTVTWTWTGSNQHDVVFNDGPKSAVQQTGTFSRQFGAAGTYDYHCSIHGAAMSGKVTIQ